MDLRPLLLPSEDLLLLDFPPVEPSSKLCLGELLMDWGGEDLLLVLDRRSAEPSSTSRGDRWGDPERVD